MYRLSNAQLDGLLARFAQTEQFAFFDTSRSCQENRTSYLFEQPAARLRCCIGEDPERFLEQVQHWLDRGYWLAGWFGYEFGAMLLGNDPVSCRKLGVEGSVAVDLGCYEHAWQFDHQTGNSTFPAGPVVELGGYSVDNIVPNVREEEYLEALDAVLEYIRAGDTYQVNYTLKLLFTLTGSPEALYRALRRNQSVAYGAYIRWGEERVMSFSPELFFRRTADRLTVRPMKGTLGRGRNGAEDAAARRYLHHDQKNRSENVMIVDLLRNDLGRVMHEAGGGEVRVRSLFDVETYESLLQMTSTIDGTAERGVLERVTLYRLFAALFPCGSVTGAPKIRTMEIIAELEKEPRGVYTGAIGMLAPNGEAVFNVPIRTLVMHGSAGEMGIGSGITHDSLPGEEWRECLLKGRFLTHPHQEFELIETLLWRGQEGYWLLAEHLERLEASADFFSFACTPAEIRSRLLEHVAGSSDVCRVRLTLAKDGVISIDSRQWQLPRLTGLPACPEPAAPDLPLLGFADTPVDSRSPWLMHKTTRREMYDQGLAKAQREGLFDVLFVNERGEVTEGAISNIFVYRQGRYLTPPVDCGLLAGTMRRRLLDRMGGTVEETVIRPEEVRTAEAVFMVNSLRGVVRVRVAGS